MTRTEINTLISLISHLVDESGQQWRQKRDNLLALASEDDRTNIEEFASWFERSE